MSSHIHSVKILDFWVSPLFTPAETNKKPRYSKEERQAIITKKKEIRLKRKNRKKAILLNIA